MDASALTQQFFTGLTQSITPVINQIADSLHTPPHCLVPEKVWREETQQHLKNYAIGIDIKERIGCGFEWIVQDMESHLSQPEINTIKKEFYEGVPKLCAAFTQPKTADQNELPASLQMIMCLSDSTIENFYSSGMRYFNCNSFEPASHVFYVLTVLDFYRHNLWLAYGLSEQSCNNIPIALQAYARAALTNAESALPYIHSVECCLQIGEVQQAKSYIDLALDAFDKNPDTNKEYLPKMIQLQQKCK